MNIKVYSQLEVNGYSLAGVPYVRALRNAGARLQWIPMTRRGDGEVVPLKGGGKPPLLALAADDPALSDLESLLQGTSAGVNAEAVLVHSMPEHWRFGFEPRRRNIGLASWEADRLPPHWLELLSQADAICVPSEHNRQVLMREGVSPSVHVVPHIQRDAVKPFTEAERADFRQRLGIPAGHFVFYTIGSWEPRKNMPGLLAAFARAFTAEDPVTLVIKTAPTGHGKAPYYRQGATPPIIAAALEEVEKAQGRALPNVCLLPYEMSGRAIDLLHEIGDCYVSLSHGEGWGLGAFDAASQARPVIMTAWGGQLDYLGSSWRGAVPYRLQAVPIFPPEQPLFWPPQRWAVPEVDAAAELMRSMVAQPDAWRAEAAAISQSIRQRFSEQAVVQQLLAVIAGSAVQ